MWRVTCGGTQLADLRTGVLDRYLPVPPSVRADIESVLFPQPDRAKFVDGVLQQLGFHQRESAVMRVGIRRTPSGASFRQDPARDRYLSRQRAGDEKRHRAMLSTQNSTLQRLFDNWKERHAEVVKEMRRPMSTLLHVSPSGAMEWREVAPARFDATGNMVSSGATLDTRSNPRRDVTTPVFKRRSEPFRPPAKGTPYDAHSVASSAVGRTGTLGQASGGSRTTHLPPRTPNRLSVSSRRSTRSTPSLRSSRSGTRRRRSTRGGSKTRKTSIRSSSSSRCRTSGSVSGLSQVSNHSLRATIEADNVDVGPVNRFGRSYVPYYAAVAAVVCVYVCCVPRFLHAS